jgi:hypothetical protein
MNPGGTALEEKKPFPLVPLGIAVVGAVAIIAFFGLRGGKHAAEAVPTRQPQQAQDVAPAPAPVAQPQVTFDLPPTEASGPTPASVAAELDHQLKRQRLWGTVEVFGPRVDVRSGACSDAGMASLIESSRSSLKGAGLTKLRCLEQSGRVVFERDL